MHLISHLGHFGHSAILLPASVLLAVVLFGAGRRADAIAFSVALGICLATTLVGKLAVHACGAQLSELDVESPSGHAAFAAMFYGCLALILGAGWPRWRATLLYTGTALFIAVVGLSRVVTEAHTGPDVVIGIGIGVVAVLIFHALRGKPRPVTIAPQTLAIAIPTGLVLVGLVLLAARHWTPEPQIESAARRLDLWLSLCP